MEFKAIIEERAASANSFEAFVGCNLPGIKDSVRILLEMIGRDGIFAEYTRHDISHINKLLEMSDWLIPSSTLERLTVADSLMITLAFYFHDLGMLVTRNEFEHRGESNFPAFKEKVFDGSGGEEYRDKVKRMPSPEAERFLYQEFVRQNHAHRIRAWITGKSVHALGVSDTLVSELEKLLAGLGDRFRKDLGLVCESHHLDDLDNLDKYKPSQPYGSNPQETANLHYSALILRTADLLHVTKDRAPSLMFRVVNPTDPKSIEEWQKQMTAVSVRPKPGLDKDHNVDPSAPRDTIEVHGLFKEPEGFFALTGYMNYARRELQRSNEWAQMARKKKGATAEFPWREIDETGVEAEGFIDKQFEFTLDQAKILNLLTGRTLYDDTTVVLRELVQNCLDAIRVQWEDEALQITSGEVKVTWSTAQRMLTIEDNGTGMTQEVIDRHFLRVGSSLYQDDEFRKKHPAFSAISRFGIGVLSAFMISDEIEVTTCSPDDPQARVLSLRSLHGKYLIRLLEKDSAALPSHIWPHGTQIKLNVRATADLKDLVAVLRRWIVFPRCKVSVVVDSAPPEMIGFSQPKDALESVLVALGLTKRGEIANDHTRVKIGQGTRRGVTLAYALEWSPSFKEWTFLPYSPTHRGNAPLIGTCIEGVRVEFSTPGFSRFPILAIANSVGPDAPKTNVARSGLEMTPERKHLLRAIYDLYCDHVKMEVESLNKERGFSLPWALAETSWFLRPLFTRSQGPTDDALDMDSLMDAASDIPSVSLEVEGKRSGVSSTDLLAYPSFWTVDSAFFSSAESLIKEIPAPVAISALAEVLGADHLQLPEGPFVSLPYRRSIQEKLVFRNREVDKMVINARQRRVDLRWKMIDTVPIWRDGLPEAIEARNILQTMIGPRVHPVDEGIFLAQSNFELVGSNGDTAVKSLGRIFVLPGPLCKFLLRLMTEIDQSAELSKLFSYSVALGVLFHRSPLTDVNDYISQERARITRETPVRHLPEQEDPDLAAMLASLNVATFDPRAWSRGPEYQ